MDEQSVMDATTGQARANLLEAVSKYALHLEEQAATRADLTDGQTGLRARLDLLNDISGFGSAVMGYTWKIPHSRWIALPFDTQLGPVKNVAVSKPVENSGLLTLKKGGLWRVDAHVTMQGYTVGVFWINNIMFYEYAPIFPTVRM